MLIDSAYRSLIHGVSKQDPKDRIDGQCTEQTNFMSEPVEGLIRRPGILNQNIFGSALGDLATAQFIEFEKNSRRYVLIIKPGTGTMCLNLTEGSLVTMYNESGINPHWSAAVDSYTRVGEYLLTASSKVQVTKSPAVFFVPSLRGIVEVRAGAYSATYTIRVQGIGDFTFTTPNGTDPSHVAQAQPDYIMAQLTSLLLANTTFMAAFDLQRTSNTLAIFPRVGTPIAKLGDITMDDGFGNNRARYCWNVVRDTTLLPVMAPNATGITVGRGNSSPGDYYLWFVQDKQVPDSTPSAGKWMEFIPAGTVWEQANATWPVMSYLHRVGPGNEVLISGTPDEVQSRFSALGFGTLTTPKYGNRIVGDPVSNPDPLWIGGYIKWMGVFQDRLTILSGNNVSMSRTKDYLNFYRQTAVSVLADGPISVSSTFGEEADFQAAVPFDRNLLITAIGQQYLLYGKSPITPSSVSLLNSSAFEASPVCPPLAHGNFAYFPLANTQNVDLQEMYTDGAFDTAVARSVSDHVDTYIPGTISKLFGSTKLGLIVAFDRSSGDFYMYRYLFSGSERVLSSWYKIHVGGTNGIVRFATFDGSQIRTITQNKTNGRLHTGILELAKAGLANLPSKWYIDHYFARNVTTRLDNGVAVVPKDTSATDQYDLRGTDRWCIMDPTGLELPWTEDATNWYIKDLGAGYTAVMMGIEAKAIWKPTMPQAKDSNGNVIGTAQVIVLDEIITWSMAGKFTIDVQTVYGQHFSYEVSPSVAGTQSFTLGNRSLGRGKYKFGVQSESDAAEITLTAGGNDPCVITTLNWRAQMYRNSRRMS